MDSLTSAILIGVLIAFVLAAVVFIFKHIINPSKLETVPRLIKDGKYQAAQRIAKAGVSCNPGDYLAHYYLGKAYLKDGKTELAYTEYKTVNEHALFNGAIPEIEFRHDMARLYKKYKRLEDAKNEYLLLTRLEPNNPENTLNAAQIFEEQGNAKLALGFYQKTIMLNKKDPRAYIALGRLLLTTRNFPQAKQVLEAAIKLSPDSYDAYFYLGKLYRENKDLSNAVRLLEKAERSPEYRAAALIEKGMCLMQADQTSPAQDAFERAIAASKDLTSQAILYARYYLGICYERERKIDKALEQWRLVYNQNNRFRDVAARLSQYKDFETSDAIKEFLTANNQNLEEFCKKVAAAGFNLQCLKFEITPYGCQMLASESAPDTSSPAARRRACLLRFYRATEPIEEGVVRRLSDTVKERGYMEGIIFSSPEFSPAARRYAENRSVTLVTKERLEAICNQAGI